MTALLCKVIWGSGSFYVVSSPSCGWYSLLWSRMGHHCIPSLASRTEERGKGKRTLLLLRARPRRCRHHCYYLLTHQHLVTWPTGCLGGRDVYLYSISIYSTMYYREREGNMDIGSCRSLHYRWIVKIWGKQPTFKVFTSYFISNFEHCVS